MPTPRQRRLQSDYEHIMAEFADHRHINIIIKDDINLPPEKYIIEYKRIKGLSLSANQLKRDKKVEIIRNHVVEIYLHNDYPRIKPQCYCMTNMFHPNFRSTFPHEICIGDYWASGETLSDIVYLIGEMIQYQNFSVKYPLNGVAAKWTKDNLDIMPIDTINLRHKEIHSQINLDSKYDITI